MLKGVFAPAVILVLGVALATIYSPRVSHAEDDWEVVSSTTTSPPPAASTRPAEPPAGRAQSAPEAAQTFDVCGEQATTAAPRIQMMVDQINELWGTDFRVYQTLAAEQPHASPGGCIFYNPVAMAAILTHRLVVNDQAVVDPLVWAIFAHEIGHQVHQDTEKSREWVPIATKELEADRFAGYTLEKLRIPAGDLTPFWNLTGDEFGGPVTGRNQHGLSSQRVAAFKQGWRLAEWNRPENSQSVADAADEATAPDTAAGAPQ